jgi:hypothetical protein
MKYSFAASVVTAAIFSSNGTVQSKNAVSIAAPTFEESRSYTAFEGE